MAAVDIGVRGADAIRDAVDEARGVFNSAFKDTMDAALVQLAKVVKEMIDSFHASPGNVSSLTPLYYQGTTAGEAVVNAVMERTRVAINSCIPLIHAALSGGAGAHDPAPGGAPAHGAPGPAPVPVGGPVPDPGSPAPGPGAITISDSDVSDSDDSGDSGDDDDIEKQFLERFIYAKQHQIRFQCVAITKHGVRCSVMRMISSMKSTEVLCHHHNATAPDENKMVRFIKTIQNHAGSS